VTAPEPTPPCSNLKSFSRTGIDDGLGIFYDKATSAIEGEFNATH
jgi:hypothetical protein